jgi:SHO1 osmosensor
MENSRVQYGSGRKRVSIGNIIGDPFALATISIAAVSLAIPLITSRTAGHMHHWWFEQCANFSPQLAWIISFFACIFAQIQTKTQFPTYSWWAVVYYFFVIAGVFVVVASDAIQTYHVAITGYLAAGLVLSTSSVNALVYSPNGAKEAAAAGFILLSMVTVCSLSITSLDAF